jgi:hypothetical protein
VREQPGDTTIGGGAYFNGGNASNAETRGVSTRAAAWNPQRHNVSPLPRAIVCGHTPDSGRHVHTTGNGGVGRLAATAAVADHRRVGESLTATTEPARRQKEVVKWALSGRKPTLPTGNPHHTPVPRRSFWGWQQLHHDPAHRAHRNSHHHRMDGGVLPTTLRELVSGPRQKPLKTTL